MGALCAHIPGEGCGSMLEAGPLTRIAQARSDLSPPGRGDDEVRSLPLIPFQ